MDVSITNAGTDVIFIPGPNLSILPGETKNWNDIRLVDLDSNDVIKSGVVSGALTLTLTPDASDAAQVGSSAGRLGILDPSFLPTYTVADLPAGVPGRIAYASDGRSGAEGAGAGTGTPVIYSNGNWRRLEDMAVVAA